MFKMFVLVAVALKPFLEVALSVLVKSAIFEMVPSTQSMLASSEMASRPGFAMVAVFEGWRPFWPTDILARTFWPRTFWPAIY